MQLDLALLRVHLALKAGFRFDQPRVPAGNPDGGQWTDGDGLLQPIQVGRRRGRTGQVRIGSRWLPATPAQQLRLQITQSAMKRSVENARKLDPKWRPRAQAYETVEGAIQANEANRLEAELRIYELTGRAPALGPFAGERLISPPPGQSMTREQRAVVDALGRKYGCHGCGSKTDLTPNGHFVGDHQISRALGTPSYIVPHCIHCSASQGGFIRALRRRENHDR